METSNIKRAAGALAVVAIMLICVIAAAVPSEAVNDTSHDVEMRVGDSFSYTPSTNLDDTVVTISGTASEDEGGFLTIDDGTIAGTPTESGSYNLLVTAEWTSPYNDSYTQTSTQSISIQVYDRISLGSDTDTVVYVLGADDGPLEYTLDYTGPESTTVASESTAGWIDCDGAHVSGTPSDSGTWAVTFTLSYVGDLGSATDTQTFVLYVVVTEDIAISSKLMDSTYIGADYTYTAESNSADIGATSISYAITGVLLNGESMDCWSDVFLIDSSTGVVTACFDEIASDGVVDEYVVTLGVSGKVSGTYVSSTADLTLYVYASLGFVTEPTIDVVVTPNETDSLAVSLDIALTGVTSVTVDWGDASTSSFDVAESVDSVSVSHGYSHHDIYTITIAATNASGDMTMTMVYDTTDGSWIETSSDDGYDWSLVAVLLVAAAILAIVAWRVHPYVWVLVAICAIAAIACAAAGIEFGDFRR